MKKTILCILVVITIQFAKGQNQTEISNFIDTTFTIKDINSYEDTLWVMDSSHFYNSINYDLLFTGKYNVLTRDESGNKLTGLGKNNRYGPLENSYLDSVIYTNETTDVNYTKTYSWSFDDYKWMDNSYQLFDNDQNLIEQYSKGWNIFQNEYINGSRTTNEYNNGLRTSTINYNYLPESNEWEPIEKQVNYYNETGKDSLQLNQTWNNYINQWENTSMNKRFYNIQESYSLSFELIWNTETEQWVNQIKIETFAIDSLNSIDYYRFNWDEVLNSWVNDIHIHSYDPEDEQMDSTTYYRWDINTDDWVFDRKSIVFYNDTGEILEYISMFFDNQNDRWMNGLKLTYLYYDNNVERITYNSDSISNEWFPYYREFHSFAYDNVTDTTQYDAWDTISQQWVFTRRYISVFDYRLNQTNRIYLDWNNTNDTWQIIHNTDYFWSPFSPLSVDETNPLNNQIKIYPNPANSVFNIEVLSDDNPLNLMIEIFDINGKSLLRSKQCSHTKQYDIKQLKKGIYLVKIQNGSSFVIKRILLQ